MTIVRVGATQKYSQGWEKAFAKGKKSAAAVADVKKPAGKASATKKPAGKKGRKKK